MDNADLTEAVARAIYARIPNTHQEREPCTATDQHGNPLYGRLISVPDKWEEAEDRHEQCKELARAAIAALTAFLADAL